MEIEKLSEDYKKYREAHIDWLNKFNIPLDNIDSILGPDVSKEVETNIDLCGTLES